MAEISDDYLQALKGWLVDVTIGVTGKIGNKGSKVICSQDLFAREVVPDRDAVIPYNAIIGQGGIRNRICHFVACDFHISIGKISPG